MLDLPRVAAAIWIVFGIAALGLISHELEPMHPGLFASAAVWFAGLIPAIGKIFD